MSEANKALARRWFEEVWNQGREQAIDEMLSEKGVVHGLGGAAGAELRGPAGFKPFFHAYRGAFPDIHIVVEEAIAEGDLVALRCKVQGTHTGADLGLAPTQRRAEFTGMVFLRCEGGKLVEAWNNFDFMGFYQQLGVLQSPV